MLGDVPHPISGPDSPDLEGVPQADTGTLYHEAPLWAIPEGALQTLLSGQASGWVSAAQDRHLHAVFLSGPADILQSVRPTSMLKSPGIAKRFQEITDLPG